MTIDITRQSPRDRVYSYKNLLNIYQFEQTKTSPKHGRKCFKTIDKSPHTHKTNEKKRNAKISWKVSFIHAHSRMLTEWKPCSIVSVLARAYARLTCAVCCFVCRALRGQLKLERSRFLFRLGEMGKSCRAAQQMQRIHNNDDAMFASVYELKSARLLPRCLNGG